MEKELKETLEELKKDVGGLQDAVKELTKNIGDLNANWEKWRKAGKFSISFMLTASLLCATLMA